MDSTIWTRLPDHLLDAILPRLPSQSLLCFRCVCRRWKDLIDSVAFLDVHGHVCSSSTPWLLMFKRQDRSFCRAYDSFMNKWRTLSISFLPINRISDVTAVACGGLLCFRTDFSGPLVVCNPITKMWKELPPLDYYYRRCPIAMVTEPNSNSFKVLIAGTDGDIFSTHTFLYDSLANCWKRTANLPFKRELRSEAPYCDGVFYFTTSEPIAILAYNVKQDAWTELAAPLPQSLTFARLVIRQDLIFLMVGLGVHGITRSLCVLQLQKNNLEWREVQRMPETMCKRFLLMCYHTYELICCIGHADYICLFCSTAPEVLVYKIPRRTWHWLPHCPFLPEKKSGGFSWFSFTPDLRCIP